MERTRTSEQHSQNKQEQRLREKADRFLKDKGFGKKGQRLKNMRR